MVFKKKKKDELPPPPKPPTDEVSAKAGKQEPKPEPLPETTQDLIEEFTHEYNGVIGSEMFQSNTLQLNLLWAIYGELRKMRQMLEKD